MAARQQPELYAPPDSDGPHYRRWRAWGICMADGTLAEVTLDRDVAQVWRRGRHKVIEFVHDEPIDRPAAAPTDGSQGTLL